MLHPALDVGEDLPRVAFEPMPVQGFGDHAELDNEIAGEVLRLDLAPLLAPQPQQAPSSLPMMVRASEPPMNVSTINIFEKRRYICGHLRVPCHGIFPGFGLGPLGLFRPEYDP